MKRTALSIVLLYFTCTAAFCQSFIPYHILRAVEEGTRTLNGKPGKNYFQNSANYQIQVNLNPATGEVKGDADIVYFNNSRDSLGFLVFRLYQNVYKRGVAHDGNVPASIIGDGMNIASLTVNGEQILLEQNKRVIIEGTLLTLYLRKALRSHDSCRINIAWNFILPGIPVHRYGKYAEGTYFVAFWYPQIAVYDDIDGWDYTPHGGLQEFYNDFNNYEVSIILPAGFMAWATGNWENPEQILSQWILDRYYQAKTSDKVVHIIDPGDITSRNVFRKKGSKTFQYKAVKVPDFAFGVSDIYRWDGLSVRNDSTGSERIFVSAAYRNGSEHFEEVAELGSSALARMCEGSYGMPYPYDCVTVFNGEGGMEYPMIVNNGEVTTKDGTLYVTMHEIAHAWFPFLTGINETKYGWIDEGLTSFLPIETSEAMGSDYRSLGQIIRQYDLQAGTEIDIPFTSSSWQTRENSYFYSSYTRSVAAFSLLEKYVGRDTFRMAVRQFVQTWQYKHPTPYDFFNIIKNTTNYDLDWFIDQWFYQPGWADLAIGEVNLKGNTLKVEIKKIGSFAVPVVLELEFIDGSKESMEWKPDIWKSKSSITVTLIITDELKAIKLGNATIPDKNRKDNYFDRLNINP
jgi:hypothetical protein